MEALIRRDVIADAGLSVVAESGMRGLTHRAVDNEAGLPSGSASNVFRTRASLIQGLAERIYARLTPSQDYLDTQATEPPTRDQWVQLMVDLLDRARAEPELHLALLELRLEAVRRPELREPLRATIQESFDADLNFHAKSGLSGGRPEIMMMHLAIGGLITEVLTLPEALGITDPLPIIEALVDRIVFGADG